MIISVSIKPQTSLNSVQESYVGIATLLSTCGRGGEMH